MKNEIEVIDNFLPDYYFKQLQSRLLGDRMPWFYNEHILDKHIGKNTKSTIISKGISAGKSVNTYRGLVQINKSAKGAENFTQCDSMLIGSDCTANTFPYIDVRNAQSHLGHEAATVKISEDQIHYFQQRGINMEDALTTIVNGFCADVFKELPTEFSVEATQLLSLKLENTVG